MSNWSYWFVTWGGIGKLKKAPGTWGTLAAVPFVWLAHFLPLVFQLPLILGFVAFSVWAVELFERQSESHDASYIVIDEVAGFWITMFLIPWSWTSFVLGFLLFRTLDILKPFPISFLDRKVPGGLGVMADDVAAGIIANIVLHWVNSQFL